MVSQSGKIGATIAYSLLFIVIAVASPFMLYAMAGVGPEGSRGGRNWGMTLTPVGVWLSALAMVVCIVLLWSNQSDEVQSMAAWLPAVILLGSVVLGILIYIIQDEIKQRRESAQYTPHPPLRDEF